MSEFDTFAEYHFDIGHAMVLSTIDGAVKEMLTNIYRHIGDAIQKTAKRAKKTTPYHEITLELAGRNYGVGVVCLVQLQ
jgi:hypothetical protein